MKKTLAVLSLFLFASVALQAETKSASDSPVAPITLGQSIVPLNGPWKFHIGDSPQATGMKGPQWADPDFDDSGWETVDLTPKAGAIDPNTGLSEYVSGWTAKGHPGYWGYAWYRIRVRVAARPGQRLALAGPADVDDAYEVFVNGALLGSFGKFPGPGARAKQRPLIYPSQPQMFLLPQAQADSTGSSPDVAPVSEVVAFRFWMEPNTLTHTLDAGGFHGAPLLGESGVVDTRYKLAWMGTIRSYGYNPVEAALFLLLALLACTLILFDRSDPVYRWLAAVFLLTAISYAESALTAWTQIESVDMLILVQEVFLNSLIVGGWVMVWWVWFRLRRPAWMPRAIVALTALYMISQPLGEDIFFIAVPHPVSAIFHIASVGIRLLFLLLLVWIVTWGIRREGREAWLALPAVLLMSVAQFQRELTALHLRTILFFFGVQITLGAIADMALAVAIFALLLRRLMLSLRHQREMALDVKQAQEVQQVLIPEELPRVPGLTIESEYRPAREVGGDFFQILPHATDGSVLIVVGDVTGKGLQAGMLVALIVGAIRAEAAHSHDPLTALNALNQRLCGRGQAHATGLALRIAADGSATLANAGHLPPYLNGKELPMEGALPLGMVENAEFSVMQFQLASGDTLMLMSDGVVEAQDEQGQLFGFERISEMLRQPITAAEVAATAQAFGQEDDISVLSVTRTMNLKAVPA
ncbi:MAG: SpoIIE family protein phosphatase [Acidobacteriaceae bacterium]